MKRKTRIHCEIAEILNKPGRFNVLTQYVDGGAIFCDNNNNEGRTEGEALALASKIIAMNKGGEK